MSRSILAAAPVRLDAGDVAIHHEAAGSARHVLARYGCRSWWFVFGPVQ
jgi:hypothetical protein